MGINILGSVPTVADLAALPGPFRQGDAYVVEEDGNLYVWNATGGAWVNAGAIVGPPGPEGPPGPAGPPADLTNLLAGAGINLTQNTGPPLTVTIASQLYSWAGDVNGNGFALNNVARLGVGTGNPQFALDVTGDVNATGAFRINGVSITSPDGKTLMANCLQLRNNGSTMSLCLNTAGNTQLSDSSNTGRLWITQAGNVGIGVALPTYPLTVAGDVNLTAGSVYRINGVPLPGQTPWLSNIDGANFFLNNVRAIGIGTPASTTPDQLLRIVGTQSGSSIQVNVNNLATTGYAGLSAVLGSNNASFMATDQPPGARILSPQNISFMTGSPATPERMRITAGGNVGIGTVNPARLLTVSSPAAATGAGFSGGTPILRVDGTGAFAEPALEFTNTSFGEVPMAQITGKDAGDGALIFSTRFANVLTERMRISTEGGVRIGGGAFTQQAGDLGVSRGNGTGVVYFGGQNFLFFDGTNWQFQPALSFPAGLTANSANITGNVNITGQYLVNGVPFQSSIGVYLWMALVGRRPNINFGSYNLTVNANDDPANNFVGVYFEMPPSDVRVKQNIRPLEGGLPVIAQLRPVEAEYNGLGGTVAGRKITSVIAQEVAPVLPTAVYSCPSKLRAGDTRDTDIMRVDTTALLSHAILAIQQLVGSHRALEERLEKLERS